MRPPIRWLLGSSLLILVPLTPVRAALQLPQQAVIVIEGGTLIDGNGGAPVRDALIVIRGNRIESVSRKGRSPYPDNARVLRADGKFILPGLMDAHVHYSAFMAELFRAHGVTSIFDNGGSPSDLIRRKAIEHGKVPGPRIFFTLEGIHAPVRPERVVRPWTVERAREAVKRIAAGGGDMVTIHRGLRQEIWEAAVDEAHKANLPVVGQPIGLTVYAREAVLAGTDILEHAAGVSYSVVKDPSQWNGWGESELASLDPRPFADMDDQKAAELIQLMIERNTYLEPDLVAQGRGLQRQRGQWAWEDYRLLSNPELAYIPAGTRHKWMSNHIEFDEWAPVDHQQLKKGFENMQQFIGRFARAGGKVMAGTDTGPVGWAVAGIGLHREMELLVDSGLTPMQAIVAATRNVAQGFRVLSRLGTVEAGKLADLIVINADPLQDIRNTHKIEWVIQDGKVVERTYNRWFEDPFPRGAGGIRGRDWVEALKKATERGIRDVSGLDDPTWAFGQPCPAIESISPTMVTEGDPTVTLIIRGFNFTSKSLVYFGGRSVPAQLVSATELRATIDADLISRARTIPIRVENPGPFLAQPDWGSVSNTAQLVVNFRY